MARNCLRSTNQRGALDVGSAPIQNLKFPVESGTENGNRPAVAVKCWVNDKLVVQRSVERLPNLKIVVGLQSFLWAVSQPAVAVKDVQAPGLEEFLVGRRGALTMPARPNVSSGRRHVAPLTLTPRDTNQSTSVNVHVSL